jgi:periplasmic divalent cation tolerance protein
VPAVSDHVQLQFTVGDRATADGLAAGLLEQRLVACVQVLGPITSQYWWEGAIEVAEEWLCLAKTTRARADEVVAAVRAQHPYEVPEVLISPVTGSADYLDWIDETVGG